MRGKRELPRKRPPFLPLALIFAAGFLAGTLFWHFRPFDTSVSSMGTATLPDLPDASAETEASPEPEPPPEPPQEEKVPSEPTPFVISFLGDCTLTSSHYTNHFEKLVGDDYAYPFSNVAEILLADDLTLANLECSFSPRRLESDSEYAFCGDPNYVRSLVQGGVEAVTLSNNHTRDFGDTGIRDTAAALAEYGVSGIPGNQGQRFELRHDNGDTLRLGAYVHPFNGSAKQMREGCERLKNEGADLVVAFMHAGAEKTYVPTKRQRELAHAAVKGGADVVVGTHPHVLQPVESYQGGVILYSIGNFCFGGNRNPSDKDTVIAQLTVSGSGGDRSWKMSYIPCRVSSVSNLNDYRPTPYPPDTAAYRRCFQKLEGTFRPPEPKPEPDAAEPRPPEPEPELDTPIFPPSGPELNSEDPVSTPSGSDVMDEQEI